MGIEKEKNGMFKKLGGELRDFILRGNVMDMAVGIIIGASFGKIVDSLVKDIIMPPIGYILGKVDFSNLYVTIFPLGEKYDSLSEAAKAGAVTINYGLFINTVISFLIVAVAIFAIIKLVNTIKEKAVKDEKAEEAATEKKCPYCCTPIPLEAKKCPHCTSNLE